MIKWLLAGCAVFWLIVSLASNVVLGTAAASSLFVIGLLVIIALNVQPKREPSDEDDGPYVPDADLFDGYDGDDEGGSATPVQTVRANPRRKKARA